ncbi:hypothetical protein LPJ77_005472 [Coemansia sp. RSA 2523]|nr:hypothetical protein LPJ54_005314 [Coemansia sp. RSA 1824]KAJ1802983.1 hypothetical protein LPJ77_005472 [Coemansia sp. RSA 2523]KAJ2241388.1 hypothetical protein GGH97_004306 [Coemansia sp. RSA 475]
MSSAWFLAPNKVGRTVAEARDQGQVQCGNLPLGLLEYNQCMSHWTDRVANRYPKDQQLIPRQEAERMSQRVAVPRRQMVNNERKLPASTENEAAVPEETQIARETTAPMINGVKSILMTTVGNAVVPFDINLFGTDGAPFIGLSPKKAVAPIASTPEALPDAAPETSAEAVAETPAAVVADTSVVAAETSVDKYVVETSAAVTAESSVIESTAAESQAAKAKTVVFVRKPAVEPQSTNTTTTQPK